jgi:hypothetical protein
MTDTVLQRISALSAMDIATLKATWRELYKTEPPKFNRTSIERRLAYRIQEIAYGGLSQETKVRLVKMARHMTAGVRQKNPDAPPVGTVLVREHRGIEHRVTVLDDGFEYQSRRYSSLSVIARAITGTQWSGPLFFGLKR